MSLAFPNETGKKNEMKAGLNSKDMDDITYTRRPSDRTARMIALNFRAKAT